MTPALLVAITTVAWLAGVVTGVVMAGLDGMNSWIGWAIMVLPALAGIVTTLRLVIAGMS